MHSPPIAAAGALIGDPARALMLSALMDGRAYTASELADVAGVTRQTASAHLGKLMAGELLTLAAQGRHRYYRLSTPEVAAVLETLMVLGDQRVRCHTAAAISPERIARTCYDHLAGSVGVALLERLCLAGHIQYLGSQMSLSSSGRCLMASLGLDIDSLERKKRILARPCLDWSERKDHLGGSLGAALLEHFLDDDWLRRRSNTRAVSVTPKGDKRFMQVFGFSPSHLFEPRATHNA